MPYRRAGTGKWWITVGGIRQTSGTTVFEDAEALEARLKHQLWLETAMGVEPAHSWQESVIKYLKERQHKPSYSTMRQRLLWWHPYLGSVSDISTITRDMVDKALHKHRDVTPQPSSSNTTANKYAIIVAAVLNAACREWAWIKSSPKFRRYPEPDHRRAFLRVDEWHQLEAELPAHLIGPAKFALATGLRKSKVFTLEWSAIDFRARSLRTTGNSIKRGVVIPLNATAMRVLEEIRADPIHHIKRVFCYEGKPLRDYGNAFYKARARAGLPEFTWHGLRHTFASWLGQSGANETVIDSLCGWAEKDTRSIYTHLDTEHLRPFAEVIDRVLEVQQEQEQERIAK